MKTFALSLIVATAAAIQWGSNNIHTHYKDIEVEREYTKDDTKLKTIVNKKTKQVPEIIKGTRTDTIWKPVQRNGTRDWLQTTTENRPQDVTSVSYSTEQVKGTQDRARYDIVEEEYESFEDVFVTKMKDVEVIESKTEYEEKVEIVLRPKTVEGVLEVKKQRPVEKTVLVPVTKEVKVTKTRPTTEVITIDVEKTRPVTKTREVEKTIQVDVEKTRTVTKTRPVEKKVLVDVEKTRDVEKTIYEEVEKTRDVTTYVKKPKTTYKLKTITIHDDDHDHGHGGYGKHGHGHGHGHKTITKKIPITTYEKVPVVTQEKYIEKVPKTITVQEKYIDQEEKIEIEQEEYEETETFIVQEPKVITETEEYQDIETYIEKVEKVITGTEEYEDIEKVTEQVPQIKIEYEDYIEKVPTKTIVQEEVEKVTKVPVIVPIKVTKQVPVQVVERRPVTKTRKVAKRRIEQAPTTSIVAKKNVSTRVNDNPIKVQKVVKEDRPYTGYDPVEVEVETSRRVYNEVDNTQTYETPFQGTKTLTQKLIRQKGLTHSHSNLSGDNCAIGLGDDCGDSSSDEEEVVVIADPAPAPKAYSAGYAKKW